MCPDCCRFTPHPDDVANSYCPACYAYKNESYLRPRCFEPSCPNFGDYDFGEATCPEDHATPPALRKPTVSSQSSKVPEATVQVPGELYRSFEDWVRSAGYGLEEIQSQTLPGDDWYRLFKVEPVDDMPQDGE